MNFKTFTKATFILVSVLTCSIVKAQDNVVKIDPFNNLLGNYSLSYERVVNEKQAFNINISFMPEKDLFGFGSDAFNMSSDPDLTDLISGFSVSPEYRFYFGKDNRKSPRGFYMAPYARVSDYKLTLNDTYEDHNTLVDASLFTTGLGLQLGAHWIFGDRFSLDWQFFGLGVDMHNLQLDYSSDEEGVDYSGYADSVHENNKDIPFFGSKLETESGEDYVKASGKIVFPGVRGRLTFGIAF